MPTFDKLYQSPVSQHRHNTLAGKYSPTTAIQPTHSLSDIPSISHNHTISGWTVECGTDITPPEYLTG